MEIEEAMQLAAQAWCADATREKVMDVVLAEEFAKILQSQLSEKDKKLKSLRERYRDLRRTGESLNERRKELESENDRLRLGSFSSSDCERFLEWLKDTGRKPANWAFTAGMARDAAYAVEQSGILERRV